MKIFLFAIVLVAFGCAGAQPKEGDATGEGEVEEAVSDTEALEAEENRAGSDKRESKPLVVEGSWENSSCGDRKYNRRVTFQGSGEFLAVDEVAPCPEDEECVWSGVIEWKGTWSLQKQIISIEPATSENARMPEKLPESFVILSESPLSIGEKDGTLICPYTRAQ